MSFAFVEGIRYQALLVELFDDSVNLSISSGCATPDIYRDCPGRAKARVKEARELATRWGYNADMDFLDDVHKKADDLARRIRLALIEKVSLQVSRVF